MRGFGKIMLLTCFTNRPPVPEYSIWYRTSGLQNDSSNDYGIVDSGGNCTQLSDLSGNNNHAVFTGTADDIPPTLSGSINGRNSLSFDGDKTTLHISNLNIAASVTGLTMFSVAKSNGVAGVNVVNEIVYFGTELSNRGRASLVIIDGVEAWMMRARRLQSSSAEFIYGTTDITSSTVLAGVVNYGTGHGAVYQNAVLINEDPAMIPVPGSTSSGTSADSTVGNLLDAGTRYPFDGLINEIIVYRRALSESEIISVSNYLKNYYKIS